MCQRQPSALYGIDTLKVQEIRSCEAPIRIANAPDCIKGVVNLGGVIVPIVNLRVRFGLNDVRYDSFTVAIILNIARRTLGMVADSLSDVLELNAGTLREAPEFHGAADASCITGLGTVTTGGPQRMLILMDIVGLMRGCETHVMDQTCGLKGASQRPAPGRATARSRPPPQAVRSESALRSKARWP